MFRAVFRATRLPQAPLPRAALPAQGSLSALRSRFALRPFSTESSAPLASSSDVLSASEQVLRPRVRPPSKTADDLRRILPIPPKPAPLDRRHGRDINAVPTFEEEEAAIIEYCDWAVDHKITVDMGAFGKAYQCYLRIKASGKIKQLSSFAWDRLLFVAARTYTVRNFNPIWYDLKSSLAPNPPSIYAFAIALHFWGVKRQMIPAMEACLNEMKAAGVAPNLQVYSTLIYVYAWAKDNQRMEQAFAQLISDPKIRPDTAVYNTLLTLHEPDGYKKPFFETPTFGYWQLLVQAADADPSGWIVPDERSFELLAEHLNYHLLIMETVQWAVQQLHHFSAATSPKYAGVRPSRKFYAKLFHLIYKRHAATKRVQRFAEMRNDLKRYAELLFQDMIKRGVMYDNYVLKPLKGLGIKTPLSGTHSVKVKRPSSNPRAAEELRANIPFEDEPLARALKFTFPLHGETRKSLREKEKAAQAAQQAADAAKAAQQESSAQTAGAANEKA